MLFRPAALILPHPMMMSCPESAQLVSHHRTVVWPLGHRWVHRFIHQEMMPDVVLKKPAAKVLCVLALRVLVLSVQESKRDQKQHVLTFCLRLWRSSEANLAVGMSHAEQIIAFVLSDMTTLTQEYSMLLECQVRSNPATHRGVCGVSIYILVWQIRFCPKCWNLSVHELSIAEFNRFHWLQCAGGSILYNDMRSTW